MNARVRRARRHVTGDRDAGAADALALVLIAPAAIGLALLVVSLGRSVENRAQTQAAAESAAQAAALQRTPAAARSAAVSAAAAMLTDPDTCGDPQVGVTLDDFRAGGTVAVTITCTASNRGLELVQDSARVHSTRAVATIDQFRVTETP